MSVTSVPLIAGFAAGPAHKQVLFHDAVARI